MQYIRELESMPDKAVKQRKKRALELGLEASSAVEDRSISLFVRVDDHPFFAGINTFCHQPYCEDINKVGDYDVAFLGVPFDSGAGYRSGTRFGPQGLRRISANFDSFCPDMGVDLHEQTRICDAGDIYVIISNLEKTFEQVTKAVSFVMGKGVFPVLCGGDHSLAYPNLRGVAEHVDGKVGIIHFDRHIDTLEKDMDERMHTCPWFHATNLPNVPATNLVQFGIGGWIGNRGGIKVARERDTTVISMYDIDDHGIDQCVDIALENAWKDGAKAVYLSFDIDVCDPGFAPGTGTPEPGGLLPREALRAVRRVCKEGVVAMELVEVSPPYDVADITSLLGTRVILDALGTLVQHGHLPDRSKE
jgi:agmatinase